MPQKTNLNVSPYYDDYDASKNFYRILFRPGYSIQARELTQLQSVLQNQIESIGRNRFKQGDLVIPGEVGLNNRLDYVKLSSVTEVAVTEGDNIVFKKYDIALLKGQTLKGITSGVTGSVVATRYATTTSSDTVYVNYTSSGNASNEATFRQGETLEVVDGVNTPLLVVGTDGSVLPTTVTLEDPDTGVETSYTSNAMGFASAVQVEEGIYFVNGHFVRNATELLVLEPYINIPSAKVGFKITESLITPEEDSTLYDQARGFANFSAPGAHRLSISLGLIKYSLDASTDSNFIQLLTVKNGAVQKKIRQADYNIIEETLARRTYDESGDYVVQDFPTDLREYYQKNGNRGIHAKNATTGLVNGETETAALQKMVATIGPGKAYIKGFEVVNKESSYIDVSKSRETLERENITLKHSGLSSFYLTNTYNSIPLNAFGADLSAYPTLYLNGVFGDGSLGQNNTEPATDGVASDGDISGHKQTTSRRTKIFTSDQAIKTILVSINGDGQSGYTFAELINGSWENSIGTLAVRTGSGNAAEEITVLSLSKFDGSSANFPTSYYGAEQLVELTILGKRSIIEDVIKEYNDNDTTGIGAGAGNRQKLCILFRKTASATAKTNAENDAIGANSTDSKWGHVISYSEMIVPTVGLAKPKNFSLQERGIGFNSDSDNILSQGRIGSTSSYNTTFKMSYFNPTFLTQLKLDGPVPTGDTIFESGYYVTGAKSKAYAVIEGSADGLLSSGSRLFVKMLSGTFVDGETINDENGNSARIAKENTISHFVVDKGGQGYSGNTYVSIDGVKFDKSVINPGNFRGTEVKNVEILDRNAVYNTYAQPPSVTVATAGTVTAACIVRAVLFTDCVQTYNPQNVKSMWAKFGVAPVGGEPPNLFTSDIELARESYVTSTNVTDFTFSGKVGERYIECTGFGGDSSTSLVQGDLIQFSDENNFLIKAIVQQATKPEGTKKSRIYLDSLLPANVNSTTVLKVRPKIANASKSSLIFPTGSKQIASLVKGTDDTAITFNSRRDFILDSSSSGGKVTFKANLEYGTQKFVQFTENNFILTVHDKGSSTVVATGDIIYIPADTVEVVSSVDASSGLTAGSVSITLPDNYFGNITDGNYPKLKLSATLELTKARPRLKTVVRDRRIIITPAKDNILPLRGQDQESAEIKTVSYSDVFKINYIYEGSTTAAPQIDSAGNLVSGTDVTNRFSFDDGQRDTLYDVSRVVIKPGFDLPIGQLLISFDYFDHSQGDFCTVDSYLHEAGVSADEIPTFNSSVYGVTNLRDVIDFRPKVDGSATITGFGNQSIFKNSAFNDFDGDGGVVSSCPASDSNLAYTISFYQNQYLDRIDGIFLTNKGEFIVKEGNASLNPSRPEAVSDSIALSYLYIPAYTTDASDVRVIPVDNKRYTMKDIGKLEKRVERLEYYTLLSVLEQQALNMQIKDEVGLERYKSGFIVDNFETHKVGNIKSIDYKCSVDTKQTVLRAQAREDSFNLEEVNTKEDERVVSGYKRSGDIITLPYSEIKLLDNPFATKTFNPNPFVVIQYVGDATLDVPVDGWYESTDKPLISDNNTQLYTIFLAKENTREAYASLYNSYSVNWIGSNQNFFNIGALADINSDQVSSTVKIADVASSSNISPQNNEIGKGLTTKAVGDSFVATSLQQFARSRVVKFTIRRLKPNTRVYPFLEGRDVSRWTNPDLRFTGSPGNSLSTFGSSVVTDSGGNASGLIIIPNGYAPVQGSTWNNYIHNTVYDTNSEQLQFTTGEKTIRFTSSSTDDNKDNVETYTEVKYYPTGILPANPGSIVSTLPAYLKTNEGKQLVSNQNEKRPNPLAQTFKVEGYEGGVFVTGLKLFFNKKASDIPVRTYLSNTVSGKPGSYVIPGTEKTIAPETFLKVYVSQETTIEIGELATGVQSGGSGPVYKVFDKTGIEVLPGNANRIPVSADQVYTLVLSNNNGIAFSPAETITLPSVTLANATNNTNITVTIAKDSGRVIDLKVIGAGTGYDTATMTIESPQLPGGTTATGTLGLSSGKLFNSEVSVSGAGYTSAPSIVIAGTGTNQSGGSVQAIISNDVPGVRMGVATNLVTDVAGSVATNFEFDYPVYLQNDTEYAFVVETDSVDYEIWGSEVGAAAGSGTVTSQPGLGSVYRSQNVDEWNEDLREDIKFELKRAEFDIARSGDLLLTNESVAYEPMYSNSVRTSAESSSSATLNRFRGNNNYVEITHRDHGFEDGGNSYVFFKGLEETGGVSGATLNTTLYNVVNSGVDTFNIVSPTKASSNAIGGGLTGMIACNKKYEKLYADIGYLSFPQTKIDAAVKTTDIIPVDNGSVNYLSYSQPSAYEKTFIGQEHYFINQKVVASRINELRNDLSNSLVYKLNMSSTVSTLSPVVDLRTSSVKTISNRIENPAGNESRYGRQNQVLEFYKVYNFVIQGNNSIAVNPGQIVNSTTNTTTSTVTGLKGGSGKVLKFDASTNSITVKLLNTGQFKGTEVLTFQDQTGTGKDFDGLTVTVDANGPSEIAPSFNTATGSNIITGYYNGTTPGLYTDDISGTILDWDVNTKQLTVFNNKQPINNDFTSKISAGSAFNRVGIDVQQPDVFRVGDLVSFVGQPTNSDDWWEVSDVTYDNGIAYVSEDSSKNTSGIAKYVTKEIALTNSGTTIDVKITANVRNISDIKVLYKTKEESSEVNFDDIEWKFFNVDGKSDLDLAATAENEISGVFEKQESYQEIPFSITNLPEFSAFAIKVVMSTDNPAYVPKLQDIRAVAAF